MAQLKDSIVSGDLRVTGTLYAQAATADVRGLITTSQIPSGAAASKNVDTSIAASSTSANLPTSAAVRSFVESKGYITTSDIPEGAAASTTTPKMDGTATIGTELRFARGDHIHPTDTSRAAASHSHGNITNGGDITATAPTIASGDQIIINDNSASKITNGPTFDGSTTTKALTPKGTWETFLQSYTETDPTVPSWAKASTKPTYTASEVGALPDSTVIPTVTDTYSSTSSNAMSGKAVNAALQTLDSSISATSNQAISAITITDGKIASSSKITVPSGAAASKGVDTSISTGSTSTNLPTTAAVVDFIENQNYVEVTDTNNLYYRGQNPITSTANDTRANWTTLGAGLWYYNQADCLIDQPYQWGYILNFVGSGVELVQFFFRQGSDQVYMRSANGTGWMTSWHQIIPAATDSFTFDSETGTLTVTISST